MTDTLNAADLVERIDSFPPMPAVIAQVMETTADEDSSASDLVRVIEQDQALAATVLKIANSPFFGLSNSVSSLQQALTVLGFDGIKNLVISKAVLGTFSTMQVPDGLNMEALWKHSAITATSSRIIAEETGLPPMDMFVAGLIHDIGKLVLAEVNPHQARKVYLQPFLTALGGCGKEDQTLGISHPEAGEALLQKWLFPQLLMDTTAFHHTPDKTENNRAETLIVHLADLMAHFIEAENDERLQAALRSRFLDPMTIRIASLHDITVDEVLFDKVFEWMQDELDNTPAFGMF